MNLTISIGNWPDKDKVDYRSPDGESGRFQRGSVFFMWAKALDPKVRFCLTLNIRLADGDEFEQTIILRGKAA